MQVLARAGVASRRAAEEIIARGQVRVNGAVVLVPQHQVAESFDKVRSLATWPDPPDPPPVPGSQDPVGLLNAYQQILASGLVRLTGEAVAGAAAPGRGKHSTRCVNADTLALQHDTSELPSQVLVVQKCSAARGTRLWSDSESDTGAVCRSGFVLCMSWQLLACATVAGVCGNVALSSAQFPALPRAKRHLR